MNTCIQYYKLVDNEKVYESNDDVIEEFRNKKMVEGIEYANKNPYILKTVTPFFQEQTEKGLILTDILTHDMISNHRFSNQIVFTILYLGHNIDGPIILPVNINEQRKVLNNFILTTFYINFYLKRYTSAPNLKYTDDNSYIKYSNRMKVFYDIDKTIMKHINHSNIPTDEIEKLANISFNIVSEDLKLYGEVCIN